jgi:sugar-specific transcriptional regulator TrmB
MDRADFLHSVGRFGLSPREGAFYLELLQRGSATARDLARRTSTERVVAYRTLDGMQARGILRTTSERPRRYWPVDLRTLFDQGLQSKRIALRDDETVANRLVTEMPQLMEEADATAPRLQILQGASGVYPQLREMVRRAHDDLKVMITQRGLRNSDRFGIRDELSRFLHGGGRVSLLVESHPQVRGLLERFILARRRFPRLEIRQLFPQTARLTIVDQREVLFFPVPDARLKGVEEMAIWTDNPDFVRSQSLHFTTLWERAALPVSTRRAGRRRTGTRSVG